MAGWKDRTPAEPRPQGQIQRRRQHRQRAHRAPAVWPPACAATIGRESPCRRCPGLAHSCATCPFIWATIPWTTRAIAASAIALALVERPLDMKFVDKGRDPRGDPG